MLRIKIKQNDLTDEEFFDRFIFDSNNKNGELPFINNFGHPFENYTPRKFIDLGDRIEIHESNKGHTIATSINGAWFDRSNEEYEDYFRLLSYIKFISIEIKKFSLLNYHIESIGMLDDVSRLQFNDFTYIKSLIKSLTDSVDNYININKRPNPSDIISCLGQNYRELESDGMIYDIIDLMMKERGVRVNTENPDELELIPAYEYEANNLTTIANKLTYILNSDVKEVDPFIENKDLKEEFPSLFVNEETLTLRKKIIK